jgi:ABC-type multidrug transport system fused ATPase/permease subunit
LEEATSSVDPESEKAILEALEVLTKGRTTIIITHRLSTLSHADRIIVVNDGTIRETGSHQELLSLNGLYRRLLETQLPYLRNQQVTTSSTRRAN